jgi:SEC-C motif
VTPRRNAARYDSAMDPYAPMVPQSLRSAMAYKESLIARLGLCAGADVPLTALLSIRGRPLAAVAPLTKDVDLRSYMLGTALAMTDCDELSVVCDTFSYDARRSSDPPVTPEEVGVLSEWFAQGRSGVSEALAMISWSRSGEVSQTLAPYTVGAGRAVEWAAPAYDTGVFLEGCGIMHEAVVVGFGLQADRDCEPAFNWRELRAALPQGLVEVMAPVSVPRVGRNLPCRCGSGLKSKKCCES